MAAERTVYVKVGAKVDGAVAGLRKVKAGVDDLTKADLKKPQAAFAGLSSKAALMGGAVALGVGKAISSFADFDAQMSAVSAALPDAGAKMEDLRGLAIQLGSDTQFSATEAAQGITEMAKAGVAAEDILNGGLKGGLDLAAAGQLNVAQASEIAATALNQFNLKGRDVGHVADLYAAAAGKAQGSVEDIAGAMKYAGVTASAMGISIEETTGVLGLFASKGIIGEQAGTSFRSMLLSLTSPSKIAAGTMEELGINVYDASGKFIGMQGAAQVLKDKLGPLDEATRNQALGQIFGNESMSAAIALYQAGGKGVADWTAKVNDSGFASKQAAKLTDNLRGDIERLGGSLDTAFIQSGSSANGALRTLVQGLGGLVDAVSKVPAPVLLGGAALTALALTVPKGLSTYREFAKSLDTLGISMDKISTKAPRAAAGMRIVGKASGALAVAATAVYAFSSAADNVNADKLGADLANTSDGLDLINKALAGSTDNGWGRVSSDIDSFGKVLGATFDPGLANNIDNTIGSFKTMFGAENVSNIANATKRLTEIDQALAGLVSGGNADKAAATFSQMTQVAQAQGISVDQLKEKFPQYAAALAQAGTAATDSTGGLNSLSGATDDVKQSAEDAQAALDDLKKAILGLGSSISDQMEAERGFQAAIDDAAASVKDNGRSLDLNTEKGRANQAALLSLKDSILQKVAADYAATGSTDKATASMKLGRDEFIKAAIAAGRTKAEAKQLADQLGLIPDDVKILVRQFGAEGADKAIDHAARDRVATIRIKTAGAAQAARVQADLTDMRFATGGAVFGAGTATSDSIPAMLSNGEHVLTAAEVAAAGGHGAIYALRKAIMTGGVQYRAQGGPVTTAYRAAPAAASFSGRFPSADAIAAAMASQMPPNLSVYSGQDALSAARAAIHDWEWSASQ